MSMHKPFLDLQQHLSRLQNPNLRRNMTKDLRRSRRLLHTSITRLPSTQQAHRLDFDGSVLCANQRNTHSMPVASGNHLTSNKDSIIYIQSNVSQCWTPGHKASDCRSQSKCKVCNAKHNTMVHKDAPAAPAVSTNTNSPQSLCVPDVLMMTAQVMLTGPGDKKIQARALIDSGPSMTLVSNKISQVLNLPVTKARVTFSEVQDTPVQASNSLVTLTLSPIQVQRPQQPITAAVVSRVTCNLPLQGAPKIQDLPHFTLADPTYHQPGKIDLLLGSDIVSQVLFPDFFSTWTREEEQVQLHYNQTVKYIPSQCRYQVTLPKKTGIPPLGESRHQALQRYHSISSGGITSTKLRVVFDASAHTSSGMSLNQSLLVGPTLHPTLETILLRFLTYPVAVSADIPKMYREVELAEEDRDLHRFLWRPTTEDPIQDFRMKRVTFGVSASPYLAVRTLQQTAQDHGTIASLHVHQSFYVDDFLAGVDTVDQALELYS